MNTDNSPPPASTPVTSSIESSDNVDGFAFGSGEVADAMMAAVIDANDDYNNYDVVQSPAAADPTPTAASVLPSPLADLEPVALNTASVVEQSMSRAFDSNSNDVQLTTAPASSGEIDGVEQINEDSDGPPSPVAMTDAAINYEVIAKQREGAPGLEHISVDDDRPIPTAGAMDTVGKSSAIPKKKRPEHITEDGGAHPFNFEQFEDATIAKKAPTQESNNTCVVGDEEDRGVGDMLAPPRDVYSISVPTEDNADDTEFNAGGHQHQAVALPTRPPPRSMLPNDEESVLQIATPVPYEPVYDGVPVQDQEPPAWYSQKQAKLFFAFVCVVFIVGSVAFGVFLPSFDPASSPSMVAVVSPRSTMPSMSSAPSMTPSSSPSMTQSSSPSSSPSMAPSASSHPSSSPSSSFAPSSSPTNECFDYSWQLKNAITLYDEQGCIHDDTHCDIGRLYGYPMNSWCVGKITVMSSLFKNMARFNEDISGWDVSSVIYMDNMFNGASTFNSDLSGWDVSSVIYPYSMFNGASAFNSDLSRWDVSSMKYMHWMFTGATTFNGDLSRWNVSSVTTLDHMFRGASAFNSDLSGWDVSSVTNMGYIFSGASAFNGDLSGWDVSSVIYMEYMFGDASAFNRDLSGWNTSSLTSMAMMFWSAFAFNSDLSDWDVSSVVDMSDMFNGASAFNSDLSGWDVSSVGDMWAMFQSASAFNSDLSGWDVSSVIFMDSMFNGASAFNSDLSEWNVSSVENMNCMFQSASSFNSDLSGWDVSSMIELYGMFRGASAFNQNLCAWGDNVSFPYGETYAIFYESGCDFQNPPTEQQGGPFCASLCS